MQVIPEEELPLPTERKVKEEAGKSIIASKRKDTTIIKKRMVVKNALQSRAMQNVEVSS
jgi:hypothetical protein